MADNQTVRLFAEELRKWWRFDDRQQHTHSWHDREDFIERKLPELIARIEAPWHGQSAAQAADFSQLGKGSAARGKIP
jgi:hypothetical protein